MNFDSELVYRYDDKLAPLQRTLMESLQAIEPTILDAGEMACRLQGKVDVEMKSHSGELQTDVVTRADRCVQEAILRAMVGTPLTQCRLLAEETPSADSPDSRACFAADASLYITVDPIDGTKRYTEGLPYYSTIIGLHDGVRPIYTFINYPSFGWWMRIADRQIATSGNVPQRLDDLRLERTIVYTAGDPKTEVPQLTARLEEMGADIRHGESIGVYGSKYLFLSGHAGGYYGGKPNLYDGLFGLHCGMARGNLILAQGERRGTPLDLASIGSGRYGLYHPGWYMVVPLSLAR